MTDYKFEGWLGLDPDAINGKMTWGEFEPKPWEETDIDIKVSHCGICGSDLHTLRSGWGPTKYPVCVGHEIVGTVVRVGSQVKDIKVGDVVGVGAQSDSCRGRKGPCEECASNLEQYCPRMTGTYNSIHQNGGKSYGGYATYHRVPAHFAIKIPEGLPPAAAAPMMCGGITVYSPLRRYGCGPGKKVGVIGVGGLGHFAILFARALGADQVVAISRRASKREDALKLGADKYIATEDEPNWAKENAKTLDLIISTISSSKMPLNDYLGLLRLHGTLVQVGAPEDGTLSLAPFSLIMANRQVAGSLIGSPNEIREMLDLAAKHNVRPWIVERPMSEANSAVVDMDKGRARYRYVLVNSQ
ncbi:hypothetical protein VTN31DRAFT_792 [Thermomyces dupontii]|uniref:uncharacterized protein n=1 Tax=Talaromyces thermophilus TaxID=28565 RepID=UPI003742A39E